MSDLSSDGKALVEAGRQADRPSDADRERVLAALRARLGDAAVLAAGLEHAPLKTGGAGVSRSTLVKWGWVAPTVLVTGALWLVPRVWPSAEKAVSAPSVVSAPPTAPVTSSPELAPQLAPEVVAEVPPSPSAPVVGSGASRAVDSQKPPARPRDGLAEEVALLSRAETELHAGRPAKALLALAEHQRKFPRGALAEERTAARIQALCALGRNDEANAQLKQLLHISPNSAQEERARQACRGSRPLP
jgi:hypothetical protein